MSVPADPNEFKGKRVLVSGGTKGLGRATVDRFLAGGAQVITSARGAVELIDGVEFVQADLTTAEGGEAVARAALDRLGGTTTTHAMSPFQSTGGFRATETRLLTQRPQWSAATPAPREEVGCYSY